jgi:uncharacterized membrane protein YfcA
MQELIIEFCLVAFLSFIIGIGSSMVGISGGAFKTPVLIIVFGLGAQFSTGVSLFSALFLAIPSTIEYNRNLGKPIMFKIGLIIALISVPGLFLGVLLKTWITDDFVFRTIFGVSLFPVALMMLFSRRNQNGTSTPKENNENQLPLDNKPRLIVAGLGFFIGGLAAGLLGIGGGTVYVPIMCLVLGLPMLVAAATSVFAMLFSSSAGTIINMILMPEVMEPYLFLFYSCALGIGFVLGSKIGVDYACSIDGTRLKRFFGAILVYPLVHLMRLGQIWLDPQGVDFLMATLGNLLIWLFIVIPSAIVWMMWRESEKVEKIS